MTVVQPYTSGYFESNLVTVESLRWVDGALYVEIRKDSYGDYDWRAMIPFAQFVREFSPSPSWGKQETDDEQAQSLALVISVPPEKIDAVMKALK